MIIIIFIVFIISLLPEIRKPDFKHLQLLPLFKPQILIGPLGECRPVPDAIVYDNRQVWGHIFTVELQGGGRLIQHRHMAVYV